MTRVAIFGGGMGGLSAAHELIERGFEVDVYEQRDLWGGKARSYGVPGTGPAGWELPAEHGFRFFPGFYRHVPDTMRRIPCMRHGVSSDVSRSLVQCTVGEFLREGAAPTVFPVRFPRSVRELMDRLRDLLHHGPLGLEPGELRYFVGRLLRIAVSCEERRLAEYEKIAWWDFVGAAERSEAYQHLLARGMTRSLVAMRAEVANTRTVGDILLQMVYYALTPGASSDRVLDGPTSKVWIDPWRAYLERRGVRLHTGTRLVELRMGADGTIAHATVRGGDEQARTISADHYVAAVPCEVMAPLIAGPIADAAPSLRGIPHLEVEWMNGVQFYLSRDVPMVFGHAIYADSTWALTSISQPQFWRHGDFPIERFGGGKVKGLLSVDISDWTDPGQFTTRDAAQYCTREAVIEEAWRQVQAHLEKSGYGPVREDERLHSHLDHDIQCPAPDSTEAHRQRLAARRGRVTLGRLQAVRRDDPDVRIKDVDLEPLLINTIDSWRYRPDAVTEIPNLFLAADYVRTHTDLATMEGANEAGRRAVNGILDAEGSSAPRCGVWPLREPRVLAPFRAIDWVLFKLARGSDHTGRA